MTNTLLRLIMKSMKLKVLLTAIVLISAMAVTAQKKNVFVKPTTSSIVGEKTIAKVHAAVVEGLSNLPTVNILDATNDGAEADLTFECLIDSVCIYSKKQTDGTNNYTSEIWLTARVKNAATGEEAYSSSFGSYSSMVLTSHKSEDAANLSALSWLPEKVERNVWKAFAVKGQLLTVEETKKDKATVVSVSLGEQHGAAAKQGYDVYLPDSKVVDEKGIKKANKPIGKVKVQDLGDEVSVCKVDKGGDKIYAAYQEDPEQLTVYSKGPSKGMIGDGKYWAQTGAEYLWEVEKLVNAAKDAFNETKKSLNDTKDSIKDIF